MRAPHGTDFAPPSSMFFSASYSLSFPIMLPFFPCLCLTPPDKHTHTHTAQSTQVISLQIGVQLVSETHQDGDQENEMGIAWSRSDSAGRDRKWDCVQAGCFLAACQPPAAALQHVNMPVAKETGRAHTATAHGKPYRYTSFPLLLNLKRLIKLYPWPVQPTVSSAGHDSNWVHVKPPHPWSKAWTDQ